MKICMVTAFDPSRTGIPKYTEGMARGIRASAFPAQLFLLVNKNARQPKWVSDSARVVRCWEEKVIYPFQIVINILKIRPQVVHVQHEFFLFGGPVEAAIFPLLLLMLRLVGFPVVVTLHGVPDLDRFDEGFLKGFFMDRLTFGGRFMLRPFVGFICYLSSYVIVHSEFARDILTECYGVDAEKVRVIPHGIDAFLYEGKSAGKYRHDLVRVLFFGFVTPTKGVDDLIRAFMLIPDSRLRLSIVGGKHRRDNRYFDNISKLASDDQRINFVGYASDRLVSDYFAESDFVVLPHQYQLSASGALAMAIAYEKPVIVTNTPYFSEVIKDGYNGLLVNVGSVDDLRNKIGILANDPVLLHHLGKGCRESKASLSWSSLVSSLWSLYTEALKQ